MSTNTIYTHKNKKTNYRFILDSNKVHYNLYTYSDTNYVGAHNKVYIHCKIHGEFIQSPTSHLSGKGCPLCYGNKKYTTKTFIIKASQKYNFKYKYPNTVYKNNTTKINIECPTHGEFSKTPANHLFGQGCPICSRKNQKGGWYVSNDDIDANNIWYMYNIKVYNDKEVFFKTGITDNYIRRLKSITTKSGYIIDILDIIIDTKINCFNLEQKILNRYRRKGSMYIPKIHFAGKTECYTTYPYVL